MGLFLFFPPISICSHVSEAGDSPLHFATTVAMSARFGMDIDVAKFSTEEVDICSNAIKAYKRIRDIVQLGDQYRVESPHDSTRCVVNFVSPDRTRAVVFVYQIQNEASRPISVHGLIPQGIYKITELHRASGRPSLSLEGKLLSGKNLMEEGIRTATSAALQATIIELILNKR